MEEGRTKEMREGVLAMKEGREDGNQMSTLPYLYARPSPHTHSSD